jgi:hypothetical protein
MLIKKGDTGGASNNFTKSEYWNARFGNINESFELSNSVIEGGQIVRDFYGKKMKPTASYRTPAWDKSKGRSGTGTHTRKLAADYKFLESKEVIKDYHQQILTKGLLFRRLRAKGITGFGLYDTFIHLDARPEGGKQSDDFGTYALWDDRTYTKKKAQ